MLLSFRITKERKKALLTMYPSIKYFLNKTIADTADKIIIDQDNFNVGEELKLYHDRRELNDNNIHGRKTTQETRDKISQSLKATSKKQGWKGMRLLPETIEKMKLNHKGMKGLKHSEETKKKMSLAHKKHKGKEESLSN